MFLGKGVLKICSKFTGEHPCRSVISIKLLCKVAMCSPVNLLHVFGTPFLKNTFGWLLLKTNNGLLSNTVNPVDTGRKLNVHKTF